MIIKLFVSIYDINSLFKLQNSILKNQILILLKCIFLNLT